MEEVSIGEFARRSRLSVKALRLYDELGVLVPARVDEASGYRYYEVALMRRFAVEKSLRPIAFVHSHPVDLDLSPRM